jgi:transcriptional regulator with XRE-family HTH domain
MGPDVKIIFRSLTDLSESPGDLLAGIASLQGTGSELHTLEHGPLDTAWANIRSALVIGTKWEAEALAERTRRAAVEAQWAATFQRYQDTTARDLVKRFGPAALVSELEIPAEIVADLAPVTNGHDTSEVDMSAVGTLLKQRREARGLSQSALAVKLGLPDASTVSRHEKTGEGAHILRLVQELASDLLPSPEMQIVMGVPPWWLASTAEARLRATQPEETTHAAE